MFESAGLDLFERLLYNAEGLRLENKSVTWNYVGDSGCLLVMSFSTPSMRSCKSSHFVFKISFVYRFHTSFVSI